MSMNSDSTGAPGEVVLSAPQRIYMALAMGRSAGVIEAQVAAILQALPEQLWPSKRPFPAPTALHLFRVCLAIHGPVAMREPRMDAFTARVDQIVSDALGLMLDIWSDLERGGPAYCDQVADRCQARQKQQGNKVGQVAVNGALRVMAKGGVMYDARSIPWLNGATGLRSKPANDNGVAHV